MTQQDYNFYSFKIIFIKIFNESCHFLKERTLEEIRKLYLNMIASLQLVIKCSSMYITANEAHFSSTSFGVAKRIPLGNCKQKCNPLPSMSVMSGSMGKYEM